MNNFLRQATIHTAPRTRTENGALGYVSTGSALIDYFSQAGTYAGRPYSEVERDLEQMWIESPVLTMRAILFVRNISRRTNVFGTTLETVQTGYGRRDEGQKAYRWLWINRPDSAQRLMPLFVLAGTWKDLWSENLIDVIPTPKLVEMIIFGLNTASTRDLVLKYLPREQKGLTDYNKKKEALRRALCEELGISNSFYRALKASGGAHKYQQLMSANRWDELDFNMFPSRALEALNKVSKKDGRTIVQRHGIEDAFASWLYSRDSVNFTGYPYELILKVRERRTLSAVDRALVNKQYEELKKKINNSGKGTGVLPVIDTSGSMFIYRVPNSEAMAIDVALSLGILLSDSLEGPFNRHFIGFSTTSTLQSLEGADFYSMATGLLSNRNRWMGSTNFASVIDLLVDLRNNNPEIPVSEFPTSLVVISDMQFNPTAKKNYFGSNTREEDNSSVAQARLDEVGLGHIQLIWWYVAPDRGGKPSHKYEDNRAYISGYDGSVVNVITGLEQKSAGRGKSDLTSEQLMIEALSQELYLLVD